MATYGFSEGDAKRIGKVVRLVERFPDKVSLGALGAEGAAPGVRLLIAKHDRAAWATGETATVFYKVKNRSDRETIGIASYNVAPERAGMFFNKISCFCFSEQTLGPGETMDMPVVFFLDPALEKDEIMKHQDQVTLSYTFYASKTPVTASRSKSAF